MARKKLVPKPGTRQYGTKSRYTENDLSTALEKIKKCEISQRKAAKTYNIPLSTLKNKLKGKHQKNVGRPQVLSDAEEQSIVSHVTVLSDLGLPLGMYDLRVIVKRYLDSNNRNESRFTKNLPGWEWGKLFIERHPVIQLKIAHHISRKRAQVYKEAIETYFENLATELADVSPDNIYNFDETGFHDNLKKSKLLFRRSCRNPEVIKNSTKSCFTVMFCASATGEFIPPFIIYKAKQKWSDWINGAPAGTRMAVTKSGWIDAETFDEWFEKQLLPVLKRKEGKKAVIGDNLSSHITLTTLKLCQDNNIKFICLLPNSTHLLQPLDVAYFSSLKANWRKVLGDWRQTRRGKIAVALPKNIFASLLKRTLEIGSDRAAQNIIAGFRACGIYPLNKDIVINKLPNYGKPIEEIREDLGESFKSYLDEVRNVDLGIQTNRKKFQIPISAGKTVSVEEVEEFYKEKEKNKTGKKKKGRPAFREKIHQSPQEQMDRDKVKEKYFEKHTRDNKENLKATDIAIIVDKKLENKPMDKTVQSKEIAKNKPIGLKRSITSDLPDISSFVSQVEVHNITPMPEITSQEINLLQSHTNDIIQQSNESEESVSFIEFENECPNIQHDILIEHAVTLSEPKVLAEYEVLDDGKLNLVSGTLEKNEFQRNIKNPTGYCIIRYEESLFPGVILNYDGKKAKVSIMQKTMEGWNLPSKPDILLCESRNIVKLLEKEKVSKRKNYYEINDDALRMEWGD